MKMMQGSAGGLEYVGVYPVDYQPEKVYPLIFLLHGFGANMHDLAGLASHVDSRNYVYLCPNGPLRVDIGPGFTGYAWTPMLGEKTMEDVRRAEGAVMAFVEEMMAGPRRGGRTGADGGVFAGRDDDVSGWAAAAGGVRRAGGPERPHRRAGGVIRAAA